MEGGFERGNDGGVSDGDDKLAVRSLPAVRGRGLEREYALVEGQVLIAVAPDHPFEFAQALWARGEHLGLIQHQHP